MPPLFFGKPDRRLFGIYREPRAATRRARVLFCYPGVQEYNSLHWAFRNLEAMLVRQGFETLRFDYFGTGDSAGEPVDVSLDGGADDVRTAADELLDMTGARPLTVVAMRFGAAFACRACAKGLSVDHLVLWEPVVSGQRYLQELARIDRAANLNFLHPLRGQQAELLGYPMTPGQRTEIQTYDLTRELPSGPRLSAFAPAPEPELAELERAAAAKKLPLKCHVVVEREARGSAGAGDSAVLPADILAAIASCVAEVS